MTSYVLGFLFSEDRESILLIKKDHPTWMAGKLNGIGGKIESGESSMDAIRRECREEIGLDISTWSMYACMETLDARVDCFVAMGDIYDAIQCTDEEIFVLPSNRMPAHALYNLPWLIPIARHHLEVIEGTIPFHPVESFVTIVGAPLGPMIVEATVDPESFVTIVEAPHK